MSDEPQRTYIITGSSSGVGAACALQLAKAGHNVVINYNKSETLAKQVVKECEAVGAHTLLVQADMAVEADCLRLVAETVNRFGQID